MFFQEVLCSLCLENENNEEKIEVGDIILKLFSVFVALKKAKTTNGVVFRCFSSAR